MRETRLALIMGGGVSLGTYTAGALTEILWALKKRNPEYPTRVEVLVGASAGAMTAALFARALVCGDSSSAEAMHRAWVEQIDISSLAPVPPPQQLDDNAKLCLLAPKIIDDIAARLLQPPVADGRWEWCTEVLRVGFTMSNISGIPLSMPFQKREDGGETINEHADRTCFELRRGMSVDANNRAWAGIRQAAVASGAFPGAFPPRKILRTRATDYPEADYPFLRFPAEAADPMVMWYYDGGVFDNEPVALARKLMQLNPNYPEPDVDYRYVVVDHELSVSRWQAFSDPKDMFPPLRALGAALLEQATAKDYLRAASVNRELQRMSARSAATVLRPLIEAAGVAGDAGYARLRDTLDRTLHDVAARGEFAPAAEDVDAELTRQRARVAGDQAYVAALQGLNGDARDALIDAIIVYETSGGQTGKQVLPLYVVAPQPVPPEPPSSSTPAGVQRLALAGAFLANFGGFFERDWRQHDFDCGRRDARAVLSRDMGLAYPEDPDATSSYNVPGSVESGPGKVSAQKRADLQTYLSARLTPIVDPVVQDAIKAIPWGLRWPARVVIRLFVGSIPDKLAQRLLRGVGLGTA